VTSSSAASTPAPSSSTAKPKTTTPPKPLAPRLPACTGSQLRVAALRGSAAAGEEFALLTFTNTSQSTCTMFGFPGVSLRLNDKLVGRPAGRTSKVPTTVTLKPGARAHANVTDFSSCQAPVSETVRIYPPNLRTFVDRPLALRVCHVVVDPVTHS
jgi:hypothetical protein